MKQSVRRALSLVMALCLLLSLAPAAFAAEWQTVTTAEQLTAALKNGGAIKLGGDIAVSKMLAVSKDTDLDLNGYTLTVNGASGMYAVLVERALTVRDSSAGETGKLTSGTSVTVFLSYPGSEDDEETFPHNSFTLLSGTVESTSTMYKNAICALGKGVSTVTITGGTVRSSEGVAVYNQAKTIIRGGYFHGEVHLILPEFACHEVTGGYFNLPFGGYGGNEYDFSGTRYEAVESGVDGYPWTVAQAFEGGVTVTYRFPEGTGLSRRDDVFVRGTQIEDAPSAPEHPDDDWEFDAWYTVDPDTSAAVDVSYPLTVNSDMTLYARYVEEDSEDYPYDDDFEYPLKTLVVGGEVMVENGAIKKEKIQGAGGGTARVRYDEWNDVYVLTLDTYVYSGEGYEYKEKDITGNLGVFAEGSLFIELAKESRSEITVNGAHEAAIGIAVKDGSLAFVGEGILGVTADGASFGAAGIRADYKLAVWDACVVEAVAKGPGQSLIGVSCNDLSVIGRDSELIATCEGEGNACARSYGVFVEDDAVIGYRGTLRAGGGDAPAKGGVSAGIQASYVLAAGPDCQVFAVAGNADDMSCGICAGDYGVMIDMDSQVEAKGGAAKHSAGVRVEAEEEEDYCWLSIRNGAVLRALGGTGTVDSYGVQIINGFLAMDMDEQDPDEEEPDYGRILTLKAEGGKAVESYGVYVKYSTDEGDDDPAISISGGICRTSVDAIGGEATDPDGNGKSFGIWTDGDIVVDGVISKDSDESYHAGVELSAEAADGSDHGHGIFFHGNEVAHSLTVENFAEVIAWADGAAEGSVGIHFEGAPGTISVGGESGLWAFAGASEIAVALNNVASLVTGGVIYAIADAETAYGIRMNADDAKIDVTRGMVRATGQTAAIAAVTDGDAADVAVTAPAIEYSEVYESDATEMVETVEGIATLQANETQKYVLAVADGTISILTLSDVSTSLSYGSPVKFTARVTPQSMVKVVEERWICGGRVISSKNASGATPTAGTYSYMLILEPQSDSFVFEEEVMVSWNGDVFWFEPEEDGRLILTNETAESETDEEEFVPDVTVSAPYYPSADTGASSEGKKPGTELVRVELPANAGQVPVIVKADGSEEIVKLSYTENGVAYALVPAGAEVKLADAKPMTFGDVKQSDWFAGAVDFVTSRGIFQGTDLGFEPGKTMSRAMLVTVLFRLSGETAPAGGTKFSDVPANAWYADAVAWASEAGVVNGRGNGFEPDAPVTREELAVMLYRFMKHLGRNVSAGAELSGFPDGGQTAPWAQEAMRWAVGAGLFRGDETGALNPGGEATRAEVAALMQRLVKLIVG